MEPSQGIVAHDMGQISHDADAGLNDMVQNAQTATEQQKNMSMLNAVRKYPKAIAFSMLLSLCIIMEAYDTSLIGSFYGLPQFRKRFGVQLENGDYQLTASWQSGLQNGTQVGQMIGLFIAGFLAERYGYKKTFIGALLLTICFVFLFVFAENIGMLFAGEVLCGLPWGAFQTLTTTYAADVTPIPLRPILTTVGLLFENIPSTVLGANQSAPTSIQICVGSLANSSAQACCVGS